MRTLRVSIGIVLACALVLGIANPAAAASLQQAIAARAAALGVTAPRATGTLGAASVVAVDAYEPDDATETAKPLLAGETANHTFWNPSLLSGFRFDVDVHSIDVVAGRTYRVHGWPTDGRSTVSSFIVGADGGSQLGSSIGDLDLYASFGSSETVQSWTATETGTVYVGFADLRTYYGGVYYYYGIPRLEGGSYAVSLEDLGVVAAGTVDRRSGVDRYAIAAELAKNGNGDYAGVKSVIIVSGLDRAMPDALSAAGLAGVVNAPVLLARGDKSYLPPATASALSAMAAANPGSHLEVHIVGGYGSIPAVLERRIRQSAPGCLLQRISGADRYAVSANVARHMRSHEPTAAPALAFVVGGQDPASFAYGLAASPIAVSTHAPILLVKAGSVPVPIRGVIGGYGQRVFVGTGLPVGAIARYIKPGDTMVDSGSNSYFDSVLGRGAVCDLADLAEQRGWVTGGEYTMVGALADALTAGASPALRGRAMLLSPEYRPPYPRYGYYYYYPMANEPLDFLRARRADAPAVLIVGGTRSVTVGVEASVRRAVGQIVP